MKTTAIETPFACDGVLSCATLSHMAKHISIRLWDDVLEAVDKLAAADERDRSQVINRTLRRALCVQDWSMSPAAVKAGHVATEPEKNSPDKPRRAAGMCVHGREAKFCVHCQKAAKGK
jgi:predicted transcriptional regulator